MRDVAQRIKDTRTSRGMTQLDLAKRLGYKSASAICQIEKNKYAVSLETLIRIADALDCDPDYLAFGSTEDIKTEINRIFDRLPAEKQEATLMFLRTMISGE